MTNTYAEVNTENFPVVKVVFTGNKATDDNFIKYLNELKAIYYDGNKLAIVFDATNAVFPNLKYQKIQADWLKDNEELMKSFCVGTAYVIPNSIIRGVLTTIFKFQKQPVAYHICGNLSDADNWVNQKLSE